MQEFETKKFLERAENIFYEKIFNPEIIKI